MSDVRNRDEAILSLKPIVYGAATEMAIARRHASKEDLISAGWIGAVQAVDSYDESRGIALHHYARRRIMGAMLDELRYTTGVRRVGKTSPGDPEKVVRRYKPHTVSMDVIVLDQTGLTCDEGSGQLFEQVDTAETVRSILRGLTPAYRQLLIARYLKEISVEDLAGQRGVHASRVSQILREALKDAFMVAHNLPSGRQRGIRGNHCGSGHPLTEDNVRQGKAHRRICLTCEELAGIRQNRKLVSH